MSDEPRRPVEGEQVLLGPIGHDGPTGQIWIIGKEHVPVPGGTVYRLLHEENRIRDVPDWELRLWRWDEALGMWDASHVPRLGR